MGSLGPRAAAFPHLFSATRIGGRAVKNRFALSPLTRSRTPSSVPNDLMRDYYASFGEVGLLISEGVHVSAQARGQLHCPGLWSTDQTLAWKPITSAAHANGCVIFAQLWHQGRTCHSSMLGGRLPFAPSPIPLPRTRVNDVNGKRAKPEIPHEMTTDDIRATVEEYRVAALNAIEAGFDGVEIHAANGYLPDEFLQSVTNHRTDAYGGSIQNRFRFVAEVIDTVVQAIGKERVGVKYAPNNPYNDMGSADFREQFSYVIAQTGKRNIAYVHLVDGMTFGFHDLGAPFTLKEARKLLPATVALIGNAGYTAETAEAAIACGDADIISFGRLLMSNPDLPVRIANGWPLEEVLDRQWWYSPTEEYKTGKGYLIPKYKLPVSHL
eukprot:m.18304 g.18304  ORF g.18304 m.18304 type:complete len:382 (+) comp30019_c0_seq1:53-1198(+)